MRPNSSQYIPLPAEDPVNNEVPSPPPQYIEPVHAATPSPGSSEQVVIDEGSHDGGSYTMVPPPYADNNDLPTYDEVERIKLEEEQRDADAALAPLLGNGGALSTSLFQGDLTVGTDSTFMLTFIIALMFSWVGFMLTFCVSNSLAGRYGAISGFGLSLVKWTLIMTHSDPYYAQPEEGVYWLNAWVWWLLIILGMTIFVRGIYMYLRAKQISREAVIMAGLGDSGQTGTASPEFAASSDENQNNISPPRLPVFYFN